MTALALVASGLAALALGLAVALFRARRAGSRARARLAGASAELERLEHAFARFAPIELVERVIASGVPTSGERKEVTVLFADLVGFTPLSAGLDASVLVGVVNGYFERMSRAIASHHGHLSTLIGDGILALFGAVETNPWHTDDAVRAALAMRSELAAYNSELATAGLPKLQLSIGLHRGTGIAGLVGSAELMQFTVVGTVVSVAARVQALTREHGVDVLLTSDVKRALDPRFALRELPPTPLKGFRDEVGIYALLEQDG
jgi:class 3 adenylate cyclase